jgi:hypothetical protein
MGYEDLAARNHRSPGWRIEGGLAWIAQAFVLMIAGVVLGFLIALVVTPLMRLMSKGEH